jgi:hypothetical protein
MPSQYLIFFFALNILATCLQPTHPTFFSTGFLSKPKYQSFAYLNIDDLINEAKKNFESKQKFVNLHKFSENEITFSFENYLYAKIFEQEFVASFEHDYLELLYGLNPWDHKFFQRLKTNFKTPRAEVEFLIGVEETYSMVNYLSGVNLIIDLQILF